MEHIKQSVLCALLVATTVASVSAATNTVNLAQYPDTGLPVPSGTVLSNQWQSIGILFSARVDTSPIGLAAYGNPPFYVLSSPDVYGAVAIFSFVDTNSFAAAHSDYFSLIAGMEVNETAQLVGLDELGNVVAQTNYTRTTGGLDFAPITLEVSGDFAKVELRTQGNPGIGASDISFQKLPPSSAGVTILGGPVTNPSNGHDYYLLDASTWSEAEQAARALEGHLATVNNVEEEEWIYATFGNYLGQPRHLWIGFYDANSNVDSTNRLDRMSEFVWISHETPAYQYWSPFEPNDSGGVEECALIWAPTDPYAGYWNDADPALTNLFGVGVHGVVEVNPVRPPRGETEVDPTVPPDLLPVAGHTRKIEQLVGDFDRERNQPTANLTDTRYQLWGTDLGVPFVHGNKTWLLFGDTLGAVGGNRDVMASTTDTNPADGLALTFPSSGGVYLPLTVPGLSQGAFEVPVEGVSANGRMVIYLTTDHSSVVPMGRSVVAVSDDDGQTFFQLYTLSRQYFINVSVVKVPNQNWPGLPAGSGNGLLIFGSGSYRQSNVRLAYQPAAEVEQKRSLLYLTGLDDCGRPEWTSDEEDAVSLFDQPSVGEFSVAYYPVLRRWVMLYNGANPRGINMRSAVYPWGPWSDTTVLFDPWTDNGYCHFMHVSWTNQVCDSVHDPGRENEWGGEYGPYLFEDWFNGNPMGGTIYFTMSTWNPYTVELMQADLKFSNPPTAPRLTAERLDGQLIIRWPCEFQNYALMSRSSLQSGVGWTPVLGRIETLNAMNQLKVPIQSGQLFLRLERP